MKSPADVKTLDSRSIFSDRTLCASPEPVQPSTLPQLPTHWQTRPFPISYPFQVARIKTRTVSTIALALWGADLALSLVEHVRMLRKQSPLIQSRLMLVWAVCSGIFVVLTTGVLISTLLRRPSRSFLRFVRGFAIFMSVASSIIGFSVMFPVIAQCERCTDAERAMHLFVCLSVPVASVWTWVWIPTISKFLPE